MTRAPEDRPDGVHNLWGFGWTGGGVTCALIVAGFFAWFYGSAILGWWNLVQDFGRLPEGLKTVLGAMVFAIAYLAWVAFQMRKEHRALHDRVARLENDAFRQKQGWS